MLLELYIYVYNILFVVVNPIQYIDISIYKIYSHCFFNYK